MSQNTIRRLFAVGVALLVVCSFAGGPAATAVAATGTVGEDVTTDLSDDADDSNENDSETGSSGDSTDEDDGSTAESGDDRESRDDPDDSDRSTEDGSSADDESSESNDRSADNVTDSVAGTADATTSAVETTADEVDGTIGETATTSFTIVSRASGSTELQGALGLPTTGFHATERAGSPYVAIADGSAPASTGAGDEDTTGSSAGSAGTVPVVEAVGQDAAAAVSGSDDGSTPVPAGLSGGATLGLGAIAAVAVARSTPLVAGAATSGSGSATSGYLATLLDKVKPFVFPLRYSRYDDSDPLEHEARELVYEIVNETPGSYLSQVSERADLPLSTTRHHMKVLEREDLVSGAKLRGKRRFYPAYAEGIELAAALNDDSTASIIDALARLGAASVSDLADDLGRDPSTISHHLQRLEDDEIITREREGRAVMNKLSGEARTAMAPETTPRPGEAAEALAD